jgi:S-formylglutathione hydrolase FrmB
MAIAAPLVEDATFHSASLDRDVRYRIYLPREYKKTSQRYPVLYLLHGLYGNYQNWDTLTHLAGYAEGLPWIIVMPDADDSWYTNSASRPQDRFGDYITHDLIAEIDNRYRTIRARHGRAIAGLSMGGYGAIKVALQNPAMFAFAGSLSGALDAPRDLDAKRADFKGKLMAVFGPPDSQVRKHNDVFRLLENVAPDQLPYFYLACGTSDEFLAINREFVAQLSTHRASYEYHETPGGHTWEYWDAGIQRLLLRLASCAEQTVSCIAR